MRRRNLISGVGAVALMASGGILAQPQELPDKTIRLVVPFSAGGSPDLIGRLMAQQYAE